MERRGWPSCLRDDLTVMVMMAGLVGCQGSHSPAAAADTGRSTHPARGQHVRKAQQCAATVGKNPKTCSVSLDSTLCISTTSYVPHAPPSRRAWSWSAAERPNPDLEPAPRTKAAARLDLEVSVGWASPSSRGLCGGDALLLKGHFLSPSKPYSCHSQLSLNRGPCA